MRVLSSVLGMNEYKEQTPKGKVIARSKDEGYHRKLDEMDKTLKRIHWTFLGILLLFAL